MATKIRLFNATIQNIDILRKQIRIKIQKMKRLLLNLLLVFLLVSCSLDDDSNNFTIETLSVKEAIVPSEFDFGSRYNITIMYDLPSGCHSFYNLYYQYEGTSRIVAVNTRVDDNDACTDDIREVEYVFEVNVVQRQDYTFKFWKGTDAGGENIFEEIIVPVNE